MRAARRFAGIASCLTAAAILLGGCSLGNTSSSVAATTTTDTATSATPDCTYGEATGKWCSLQGEGFTVLTRSLDDTDEYGEVVVVDPGGPADDLDNVRGVLGELLPEARIAALAVHVDPLTSDEKCQQLVAGVLAATSELTTVAWEDVIARASEIRVTCGLDERLEHNRTTYARALATAFDVFGVERFTVAGASYASVRWSYPELTDVAGVSREGLVVVSPFAAGIEASALLGGIAKANVNVWQRVVDGSCSGEDCARFALAFSDPLECWPRRCTVLDDLAIASGLDASSVAYGLLGAAYLPVVNIELISGALAGGGEAAALSDALRQLGDAYRSVNLFGDPDIGLLDHWAGVCPAVASWEDVFASVIALRANILEMAATAAHLPCAAWTGPVTTPPEQPGREVETCLISPQPDLVLGDAPTMAEMPGNFENRVVAGDLTHGDLATAMDIIDELRHGGRRPCGSLSAPGN